jgi:MFS family permease
MPCQIRNGDNKSFIFKGIIGSVFILNAAIFFFQALTKNLFPPLLLPLRETFLLDNTEAGLLVTLVFFGYALARFPSGILADIYGCARIVLLGSLAMALSFLAIAFSPSYPLMAVITFILGLSSGVYVTAGYTLAVIIGSRERAATATAAFESFGLLAGIVSPALVTLFVLFFNWQLLFIVAGLLLLGVTVMFYRKKESSDRLEQTYALNSGAVVKDSESVAHDQPKIIIRRNLWLEIKKSSVIFSNPLLRRFIVWSTLVGGFGALSWTGITSFIPTFLVEIRGYSYDIANRMFIIVAVAGLLAKMTTGWLADRFGNNPILFVNLTLSVGLFIALSLVGGHWQLLVILALLGAACLNTNTLINSYVLRNMPPRYQGAGFGLFCTAYTIIYSFGPYLTGYLSDQFGLVRAVQISSFGAVIAALLIVVAGWFIPQSGIEKMSKS